MQEAASYAADVANQLLCRCGQIAFCFSRVERDINCSVLAVLIRCPVIVGARLLYRSCRSGRRSPLGYPSSTASRRSRPDKATRLPDCFLVVTLVPSQWSWHRYGFSRSTTLIARTTIRSCTRDIPQRFHGSLVSISLFS